MTATGIAKMKTCKGEGQTVRNNLWKESKELLTEIYVLPSLNRKVTNSIKKNAEKFKLNEINSTHR